MTETDVSLPDDYPEVLERLKEQVRAARAVAHRTVNTELLRLYWTIGTVILDRQERQGWGAKVISRLAQDLQAAFPESSGLSRSNLEYMRRFAAAYPSVPLPQQAVGELPWGHITVLLDKLSDQRTRDWYAAATAQHGWSRAVMLNQIKNQTHLRLGAAPSNFAERLPTGDSELARDLAKDPFVFDFLGLSGPVAERELEQALMDRLHQTLSELGRGFSFVGRQVHFDVDGDDFYIDLLFFHVEQLRYVVVELKIGKFEPGFAGQLNFYVGLVDDRLRRPQHAPTVGLLLCADRNERVVRYALAGAARPLAVSTYIFSSYGEDTYAYDTLPAGAQEALPAVDELTAALEAPIEVHGEWTTLERYLTQLEHDRHADDPNQEG